MNSVLSEGLTLFCFCDYIVCCIYHKPKRFDESSDESSSSSDSDSGSDSGCQHHHHDHDPSHARSRPRRSRPARSGGEGEGSTRQREGADGVTTIEDVSDSDTNAYEAQPSASGKKRKPGKRPVGAFMSILLNELLSE